MKNFILFLVVSMLIISCNKQANGEYTITGNIEGMSSGLVFLKKPNPAGMGLTPIDTVKIIDGKFEIKGKVLEPEINYLQIDKIDTPIALILEEGNISVQINKDSISNSKISGTYNNDEFTTFNKQISSIRKRLEGKISSFQKENMDKMMEAQKTNDTATINSLSKQYELLQKDLTDYTFGYPKQHPKSFLSVLITQAMLNKPDFKMEEVETIFNSLDENLKTTKIGKEIKESITAAKNQEKAKEAVKIGAIAPDFKAPNPEGKMISLKESMGKVTLIDFWASWCAPCRAENPNVVAVYNDFHKKGFNVIGISLDGDTTKWKEAIAKDKLTWNHISNLKKWDEPIAIQYGINQIPSNFLLDESGKIIATDLKGADLRTKISEILK